MANQLFAYFKLLRPKQWTKNLLLFAGLVFSNHYREANRVYCALIGFAVFCGLSCIIYIINDYRDMESDRQHPLKCRRPLASGEIKPAAALVLALGLALGSTFLTLQLPERFQVVSALYLAMMVLYSLWLKHIVILDLMIVAIGFVIRAVAGIYSIEKQHEAIIITPWFITCVLFLALFIVICKRRHEIVLLSGRAHHHRPVLEHYSPAFLDQMVNVATTATVISYALYATLGVAGKPGASLMVLTLPFVIYGVFRYLYLVYKRDQGGSPEILLFQDAGLLIAILLWIASYVAISSFSAVH
jgi:4-hydroxybenzoate polyprenyltransferase